MTPLRIQLRRSKGWRMPPNTVKVDRTTKWGNPFKVGQRNPYGTVTHDARHSAAIYAGFAPQNEVLKAMARDELRGRNLACWCALCDLHRDGKPLGEDCPHCERCHVDTLLPIANAEEGV